MSQEQVLSKIKTRGYWRINFQPLTFEEKLTLTECKEKVSNNAVAFRGWDYPHIPQRKGPDTALEPGQNFWQGWLDWEEYGHIEFWRMYQSGQFIHYRAIHEDWGEVTINNVLGPESREKTPGKLLGVIGTVYLFTEIFQFLSRITREKIYKEGVKVSISLVKTDGRRLYVEEFMRTPFFHHYETVAETITFEKSYLAEEIIANPNELALNALLYLFERFEWQANVEQIKLDQEKLISRRF